MAKILRKAYKIFGSGASASAGGLEQFGGLAAGAVNYSTDPETLQALNAWVEGWNSATLGTHSPVLEERNAVDYVHGYQIGYLLQQGVPEWLSTQTYYKNNYVVDSDGKLRVSFIDNNVGHDPSLDNGGQYWGFAGGSGSGKSVGEVFWSQSSSAADNPGALPLFTGETIASADTVYPDFYAWVLAHPSVQCTNAYYDQTIAAYGECPRYVIDTVNKTIRLPLLKNYIKNANTTDGITQSLDGLPNITGTVGWGNEINVTKNGDGLGTGALYASDLLVYSAAIERFSTSYFDLYQRINLDASRSNSKYGASNKVTPAHTTLFPWVCAYSAAVEASVAQAAEFQNALSGKADVNLGNLSYAGQIVSAKMSMPSDTRESVVLGVSGTSYTAPADGYFNFRGMATVNGQFAYIGDSTYNLCAFQMVSYANNYVVLTLPVKKGQTIIINYDLGANLDLNFIYAEGSKSEAA